MREKGKSAESHLGLPEYRGHSFAEKAAFGCLILFVAAAIAGAFGDGPVSNAVTTSEDGALRVEYQRFARREARQALDISVPTQPGANEVELRLGGEYLQRVRITEIFPHPLQSSGQESGRLRFATDGSGQPVTVRIHLQAQQFGSMTGSAAVATHGEARFKQFVYP
jgi:hypothetical protein